MAVTTNSPGTLFQADFRGDSTDEKPTDCGVNSWFFEQDTGDCYYFDEDSEWKKLGGDA